VSTTAPLLQRLVRQHRPPRSRRPLLSLRRQQPGEHAALLSYPVVVEPLLPLHAQSLLWTVGYGLLVLLVLGCGVAVWLTPDCRLQIADCRLPKSWRLRKSDICNLQSAICKPPVTWGRRLRWVVLAALPCSLMLSVTT